MQKTIIVPASSTPTTVTVDIADPIIQVTQQGGTPIVTPPPVVTEPPTDPLIPSGMKRVLFVDFEDGSTKVSADAASQAGAGKVVDYNGSKQFRAYVAAGSKPVHSGYRSELRYENISDAGRTIYQFDVTFVQVPSTGEVQFFQVHPQSSDGSSLFRLQCHGSQFSIVRNPAGRNFYETVRKPIVKGQKYRILIDANWSTRSDGFIKVYIDGVLFYSFTGVTGVGYSKFFINAWSSSGGSPTQNTEIYGDNISIYKP